MPSPPQPLLLLSSRPWNGDLAKRLSAALRAAYKCDQFELVRVTTPPSASIPLMS
jgi:hypothetical protein